MSVLDIEKVDGIALDGEYIRLFLSDHLEWNDEYEHLLILQNKINAYIAFCENEQFNQVYPNRIIKYAIFEIHFKYEPTVKAMDFLEQVQRQLNEIGITIECHMSEVTK